MKKLAKVIIKFHCNTSKRQYLLKKDYTFILIFMKKILRYLNLFIEEHQVLIAFNYF